MRSPLIINFITRVSPQKIAQSTQNIIYNYFRQVRLKLCMKLISCTKCHGVGVVVYQNPQNPLHNYYSSVHLSTFHCVPRSLLTKHLASHATLVDRTLLNRHLCNVKLIEGRQCHNKKTQYFETDQENNCQNDFVLQFVEKQN